MFFSCTDEGNVGPDSIECETEPIDLGEIFLDPVSLLFLPYSGQEIVVFKNAMGDEALFEHLENSFHHSIYTSTFKLICMSGDTNEYTYKGESYALSKRCELLDLNLEVDLYPSQSFSFPLFNDQLVVLLQTPSTDLLLDTIVILGVVTNYRGNGDLTNSLHDGGFNHRFVSDTSLLNVDFHNLYVKQQSTLNPLQSIYYTKELGVVAFEDVEDVLWVYDRVE